MLAMGVANKTSVFFTAPLAEQLEPKESTSIGCDRFLYFAARGWNDADRVCKGFDDGAESRCSA